MSDKKHVEFRYYDIPHGDIVFPLTGSVWNKEYGEGKEKLHFHNYYEVGHCYEGEGEMILGERTAFLSGMYFFNTHERAAYNQYLWKKGGLGMDVFRYSRSPQKALSGR